MVDLALRWSSLRFLIDIACGPHSSEPVIEQTPAIGRAGDEPIGTAIRLSTLLQRPSFIDIACGPHSSEPAIEQTLRLGDPAMSQTELRFVYRPCFSDTAILVDPSLIDPAVLIDAAILIDPAVRPRRTAPD